MKHILLLTDYSPNAHNAVDYALQLFEKQACTFHLCHIKKAKNYISDDLMSSGSKSIYGALVKDEKSKLKALAKELKARYRNSLHKFKVQVDVDSFIDAIKQNIEINTIDLLVMGSNGASNAEESIFGSNTLKVIRNINLPTLVIPIDFKYRALNDILLPLDTYDPSDSDVFREFLAFSKPYNSTLHILRITNSEIIDDAGASEEEHLNDIITENDFKYHYIKNVPLHFSASNYIQTHNIDLMVLMVQNRTLFERLFFGSNTIRLTKQLEIPLMVYHY